MAARSALSGSHHIVVIDDFHYVHPAVQLAIVRGLKDPVFDGLGVVFASVPHRAYDAVRVEKEMTGRVTHRNIEPWDDAELTEVARRGFAALKLVDDERRLAERLARESFASPHLMQDFCRRLCRFHGIAEFLRAVARRARRRTQVTAQSSDSWTVHPPGTLDERVLALETRLKDLVEQGAQHDVEGRATIRLSAWWAVASLVFALASDLIP